MPIQVNRAELLTTLAKVQPGLSGSDVYEQSSSFCFDAGWLMTFNGEIAIRTKSGLPPQYEGAVKAKPLIDALAAVPDETVEVDYSQEGRFRVRGGGGSWFTVRQETEIRLPMENVELPQEWVALPEDFAAALKIVLPAAGKKEEEFVTSCLHVTPDFVECCDRIRLCRYNLEFPCEEGFLIRAKSATAILAYDVVRFGLTENWAHFRNGGIIFSCTRHKDDMPDLSAVLAFRGTEMRLVKEAEVAAVVAGVFSAQDKADDKITVELTPGRMNVFGRGAFGEGGRPLTTNYDGPPLGFRISPASLIDLVKHHDRCEVGQDQGGNDRLRIDGERWAFVTSLGKVDDAKAKPQAQTQEVEQEEQEPELVEAGDES